MTTKSDSNKVETKVKVLDAAEALFADQGFSNTSLRMITTAANVNLASVNYHFGSKKSLIQAVLQRYFVVFMPELTNSLVQVNKNIAFDTLAVFSAFIDPLLKLDQIKDNGTAIFLQLLGRGYSESQGHLRRYISEHYGDVLQLVLDSVKAANPAMADVEVFWRLHFTLGTVVFTMASSDALSEIAASDFDQHNDIEAIIRRLLPYLAAGMEASAIPTSNIEAPLVLHTSVSN